MEIQTKIAEKISEIAPSLEKEIIEALVNRELSKRSTAIVTALDELSKMEKDLKKVKPDQQGFDGEGKVVSETYSKAKLEEMNKLKQKIEKFTKAIDKALNGDMGDVYNLNSSKD